MRTNHSRVGGTALPGLLLALSAAACGASRGGGEAGSSPVVAAGAQLAPSVLDVTTNLTPRATTLDPGSSIDFSCEVTATTEAGCDLRVREDGGGTVSTSGHYQAPPTPGIYHLEAKSQADPSSRAVATVFVVPPSAGAAGTPASPSASAAPPPPGSWSPGAEFFVAPDGSDANPGTMTQPFASLARASSAVRALKAGPGLPANGIAVTVRGGVYRLTAPLSMDASVSGAPGRPVIWRAYGGEVPRVSGGKRVTGWSAVTAADPNWSRIHAPTSLFRAALGLPSYGEGPPTRTPIAELFYQDAPMRLGRWPKGAAVAGMTENGTTITSSSALPAHGWSSAAALSPANRPWAYLNPNGYTGDLLGIDSVSGDSFTVDEQPSPPDPNLATEAAWYATNLLEEVSEPGEYWIDRVAGVAYLSSPDGANPDASGAEVVVSELTEPLVTLDDTSHDIWFDGLTFEHAQGDLVHVAGQDHVLSRCTFRDAAQGGLTLSGAGHSVVWSRVYSLGAFGIRLTSDSRNVTVSQTEIHHVARHLPRGNAGVLLDGSGHTVRSDALHDLPWDGIVVLGKSALIELNELYATQLVGADVHAIYAWANENADVEIRYNYLHDVVRRPWPWSYGNQSGAITLDTLPGYPNVSGFRIHGNVVHRFGDGTATSPYDKGTCAGVMSAGTGNSYEGNVFVRVDVPYRQGPTATDPFVGNQSWLTLVPLGSGNVSDQDPGFVDEPGGNLANRPDGSLVVAGSSEVIPFSSIGIP